MERLDLRGKELVCYGRGNEAIPCYVAHVDREIGITIKRLATDKDEFCLNKKEFLNACDLFGFKEKNRLYHDMFSIVLNGIESGSGLVRAMVDPETKKVYMSIGDNYGESMSCPWS